MWTHQNTSPSLNSPPNSSCSTKGIQASLLLGRSHPDSHSAILILGEPGLKIVLKAGLATLGMKDPHLLHSSIAQPCWWAPLLRDPPADGAPCHEGCMLMLVRVIGQFAALWAWLSSSFIHLQLHLIYILNIPVTSQLHRSYSIGLAQTERTNMFQLLGHILHV